MRGEATIPTSKYRLQLLDLLQVYKIVHRRTIGCQMQSQVTDATTKHANRQRNPENFGKNIDSNILVKNPWFSISTKTGIKTL